MKNITLLILTSLVLYSCNMNKDRTISENEPGKDIPKVLTEEKNESYDRSNYSNDLVESLYEDLMKKDEKLKELHEKINKNFKTMNSVIQEFEKFTQKSNQYYLDAESKAFSISDSLLKIKIQGTIKISREKYNQLISNLNKSDSTIKRMHNQINGYYAFFKIQKTLPIIEKYQKEKLTDNKKLEDFIEEQNKLLEQIK
jgi:hypothetical protein